MNAEPQKSTQTLGEAESGGGLNGMLHESAVSATGGTDAAALDATVLVRRGDFVLDARIRVESGEIVAVLGPNGSGKSTFLQAVAGLLPLESGTVTAAGRVLSHREANRQTNRNTTNGVDGSRASVQVAPEHRGIGLLGQDPLLFPHLSAVENVAFGRRALGAPKATARREALDWLEAVQLPEFAGRRPTQLSGGQQQRVAIARALAAGPSLLLLDEPMAALDVQSAPQIRILLREQLSRSGTTAILVTHDVLDAIVLADRIVILDEGRVVDQGATTQVLARPRNRFVADLVGVNLVSGVADAATRAEAAARGANTAMYLPDGRVLVGRMLVVRVPVAHGADGTAQAGEVSAESPMAVGNAVHAVFRPAAVRVERSDAAVDATLPAQDAAAPPDSEPAPAPHPAAVNRWPATVLALEPASGGIRIRTDDPAGILAELPAVEVAELRLEPGCGVYLSVDAADVTIHAAAC